MVLSALLPYPNIVTILVHTVFSILSLLFIVECSCWLGLREGKMQQIRFNYSLKNIGLATHEGYQRNIIDKTENLIQRMRWKAHFFLNDNSGSHKTPTFGMKSKQTPPPIPELKSFEEDVIRMIENIQFRNVNDQCISTLKRHKQKIKASPNRFIFSPTRLIISMKVTLTHITNC